jgi:hypothetical protein
MKFLKIYTIYLLRVIINFIKFKKNNDINNLYLPNYYIRNTIFINPSKIDYINSIPLKFYKSTKFIINFDWDTKNENINKHAANDYKFLICENFNKHFKINSKNLFITKKENFKFYKKHYDHNKKELLKDYLSNKINLFKSIKKKGLKKKFNSNIQFMIDRNFNLVKINSGDHRFAISRILKLKKIPIDIKVIHKNCIKPSNQIKILEQVNNVIKNIEKKYR